MTLGESSGGSRMIRLKKDLKDCKDTLDRLYKDVKSLTVEFVVFKQIVIDIISTWASHLDAGKKEEIKSDIEKQISTAVSEITQKLNNIQKK